MDQSEIDKLVHNVLQQMGYAAAPAAAAVPVSSTAARPEAAPANAGVSSEGALPDLGSDEFKYWIGVREPHNLQVLKELRSGTQARVCVGRTGPRPRTTSLLRFLADHSRSKDTVLKEISADWVTRVGLFEVQSQITDKDEYLTRPDKGRLLSAAGLETVLKQCKKNPQVQVVVSDGLSTDAITANLDEILPPLLKGLKNANIDVGNPFFVRYGRVKIEDQIGEALGAQLVILLIGERPGLGQSESLSCYMVYGPTAATVEAERTCISNIHRGGTPPVEAAGVIVDLAKQMLTQKVSGIALAKR
jgi:ethanolamine ammonia-lyase small subunit